MASDHLPLVADLTHPVLNRTALREPRRGLTP